jgi:hypothetical protein
MRHRAIELTGMQHTELALYAHMLELAREELTNALRQTNKTLRGCIRLLKDDSARELGRALCKANADLIARQKVRRL